MAKWWGSTFAILTQIILLSPCHHTFCLHRQKRVPSVSPLSLSDHGDDDNGKSNSNSNGLKLPRVVEISSILLSDVLLPLVTSGGDDSILATRISRALERLGPTYAKFGQALGNRPDIVSSPALIAAFNSLQDDMEPFDTDIAKRIVMNELGNNELWSERELESFVDSFSEEPVAAASIGQVYSGVLPRTGQKVAVKVQRPGIRETVRRDAELLRFLARIIPAKARLEDAVEEFMSRMFEELDYQNEAANIEKFASLYSHRRKEKLPNRYFNDDVDIESTTSVDSESTSGVSVFVPQVYRDLCTDNVIVMEWVDGSKLVQMGQVNVGNRDEILSLIQQGIKCTLSQLLETGVMHADPHGGNLLKVNGEIDGKGPILGYVDFGLMSTVPVNVRDGLVCAVAQMVFAKDVDAVVNLFGELCLIPQSVLDDPVERQALGEALESTLNDVLVYPHAKSSNTASDAGTQIPNLKFDKLLESMSRLVPRFEFQLPPYFLNNARALGTLEGMAKIVDPSFNVLRVLYPYALTHLISNPNDSPVVERTLQSLIRAPSGSLDMAKAGRLLSDSAELTGQSRARIVKDVLKADGGNRLARDVARERAQQTMRRGWGKLTGYLRVR